MSPIHKIGLLLYPNADLLDFTGPLEVFSHALHNHNPDNPDRIFSTTTLARAQSIPVGKDSLTVTADVVLSNTSEEAISQLLARLDFDILMVPGAPPAVVTGVIEEAEGVEKRVVRAFVGLDGGRGQGRGQGGRARERILFSVCTGAVVLGAAGVLGGMRVTTHYGRWGGWMISVGIKKGGRWKWWRGRGSWMGGCYSMEGVMVVVR
ncbi:hypothetical protein P168DRAFT_98573 [Aspergillus campestris IBT 28561]|uniref:DJ-1/PfpI domain-containing protein n=1 Tax=Aspergillus campestris (strain IBT 28561) TaxID=1392248 RepID=A0A2I1DCK2_ASPC2|nr:uncharacterized protein P168DRAFT_98573 [Aspergillus campestris IBT 28561]PKY07591.1 hypothetical protein P168DRAFT_98573 [Aspergillus campestris IBT 28561]